MKDYDVGANVATGRPDTSPPQSEGELEPQRVIDFERLDEFGKSLAKLRSAAIKDRKASGIEDIWREDEEYYEGIDEKNRSEERATWRTKPPGQTDISNRESETQSTLFMNITGPFVESGSARIADMLMPMDDKSWRMDPTPVPELVKLSKGDYSPELIRQANLEEPDDPERAQELLKAGIDAALKEAKDKTKLAEKRIEDWMEEAQWHAQNRLIIEDAARVGTGVLKGPVAKVCKRVAWSNEQQTAVINTALKPESRRIDYWNLFPEDACGDNIHNGSYVWERDHFSKRQVRDLKSDPECIKEQIDKVLKEGPHKAKTEYEDIGDVSSDKDRPNRFEVWYFTGTAEKADIEAGGHDCSDIKDAHMNVHLMMINNSVVKVTRPLLSYKLFPYDVMVWRKRANHWTGIGLGREIRPAQKMLTAAIRHLNDNAGQAAGPMGVYRLGAVYPADGGKMGMGPRRWYAIPEDADPTITPQNAIGYVKIDMMINELLAIIELALRFAELLSGMPLLMQGQPTQSMPKTLGGQQLFANNASVTARRIAKLFDDRITEPQIQSYYEYLLVYGENDEEKGDYLINATGSSALVDREIQNQELISLGMLVLEPRYGIDPEKWAREYLKSRKFDPHAFAFDDDDRKQLMQRLAQGGEDSAMDIAQLKDDTARWAKAVDVQLEQLKLSAETGEKQKDRDMEMLLATLDQELAEAELSGRQMIEADKIKGMLAQATMRLTTQARLANAAGVSAAPQVAVPAIEPAGRAPNGQAFQK